MDALGFLRRRAAVWSVASVALGLVVVLVVTAAWSATSVDPGQADFDASGRVDFDDFLTFASTFGKSTGDAGVDIRADLDGSGKIDFSDFLLFAAVFGKTTLVSGEDGRYQDRFVFVSLSLLSDDHVEEIRAILDTAAANGLNGMVLSAGWDQADLRPQAFWDRLATVKEKADVLGIEIIPLGFSAGYGGGVLAHNPHLAAGLLSRDAYYEVEGLTGRFVPDTEVGLMNGSFDQFQGNTAAGFDFHDKPGEISFVDNAIFHSGPSSIRFEQVGVHNPEHGHARIMQTMQLKPNRQYKVSLWVKTQDLEPVGGFRFLILSDDRSLAPVNPHGVTSTMDWTEMTFSFNSLDREEARLYVGQWGGKTGTVWIDDMEVVELGPVNVLKRAGTPLSVTGVVSGITFTEGVDYEVFEDAQMSLYSIDHAAPELSVIRDSRLDGFNEDVRITFYHPVRINTWQVSACMSEPEIYEIWRNQVRLIEANLGPDRYFLSQDEIRAGGSCVACKSRSISMGEILGDCITQQVALIRESTPDAQVYVWSDMLDPNHNAHGDYYMVEGDYGGSWNHVPKDLVIATWYHAERDNSLPFFSNLGFSTLAGAYYDGDDLSNIQDWMTSMEGIAGGRGIMYTTWQNKYELLGAFGRLVGE